MFEFRDFLPSVRANDIGMRIGTTNTQDAVGMLVTKMINAYTAQDSGMVNYRRIREDSSYDTEQRTIGECGKLLRLTTAGMWLDFLMDLANFISLECNENFVPSGETLESLKDVCRTMGAVVYTALMSNAMKDTSVESEFVEDAIEKVKAQLNRPFLCGMPRSNILALVCIEHLLATD